MEEAFQVFGSPSSVDLDVVVFVDAVGTIHESSQRCKSLLPALQARTKTNKPININLAVVKRGVVVAVFKGTADELNNALYHTYQAHEQYHPQQVVRLVARNLDLKLVRSVRKLVSCFTRTTLRPKAKQALKDGLSERIAFLKSVDLITIDDFGKYGAPSEIHKLIAFTIAQTDALINGIELYSKEEAAEKYPQLAPFLQRAAETDRKIIQDHFSKFVDLLDSQEPSLIIREE